jgi:hypothetical protein
MIFWMNEIYQVNIRMQRLSTDQLTGQNGYCLVTVDAALEALCHHFLQTAQSTVPNEIATATSTSTTGKESIFIVL